MKINSILYTEGKKCKNFGEICDTDNENLYSKGKYKTKIKKEDLPKSYIQFKSRTIWYMTGYIKTTGIVDIQYESVKNKQSFKDDCLYISYKEKLRKEKNIFGIERYLNYDICICGNDIMAIMLGAEKYSKLDIGELKKKLKVSNRCFQVL